MHERGLQKADSKGQEPDSRLCGKTQGDLLPTHTLIHMVLKSQTYRHGGIGGGAYVGGKPDCYHRQHAQKARNIDKQIHTRTSQSHPFNRFDH